MKTRLPHASLFLAVLAASSAAAIAAPVPVTGTMTYNQNFDILSTGSPAWVDDSLLPGWYAQINNGNTPAGNVQVTNGSASLDGLLNCGATGAVDRALGSKATGSVANIAYAVSFQNTSTNPIQWTGLHYTGECWRTNSSSQGTTAEVFTVFYQVSPAPVTNIISSPSTAPTHPPAAGAGFTAIGTAANWTSPVLLPVASAQNGNGDGNFTRINYTPAPPVNVLLQPGQCLMIKWTDSNLGGTDGFQAIDDVAVDFTQLAGSVVATPGLRTRNFNGTPTNLTDDSFGVSVHINGSGSVTTWTAPSVNPPAANTSAGAYGDTVVWTGFPVSGPKAVTITDATNGAFNTALSIQPLTVIGSNDLATPGLPILHEDVYFSGWTVTDATRTLTQKNPGTAQTDYAVNSEIIDLSSTGYVLFQAHLKAIAGTTSGFEAGDRFAIQVIVNGGTPVSVLGSSDTNADGYLSGVALNGGAGTELPGADIRDLSRDFTFNYFVPDTANTLQFRIIGNSNSAQETYEVSGIKLLPPPPTVLAATGGPSVLDNKGTVSPADDEFSTPVVITPVNLAGSPGWTSNATPNSGVYSPVATTFGPFPVSGGPKPIQITDQTVATTASLTLPLPPAPVLTVSAPANVTRILHGPGPADDTVTFQVSVTATSSGPSWTAAGVTPSSGPYGPGLTTFTIPAPLPAGPLSVVFADASYPAATQTASVTIPPVYTLGQTSFGIPQPVFSLTVYAPDTSWTNNAAARTLTINNDTAAAPGPRTITSEVIDLSAVAGIVTFSANLHVHDVTRGFEAGDTFNAWLIFDGVAGSPVSLIGPHDDDASGSLSGAELCPVPVPAGNVTQDFDYPLTAPIPNNVQNVQLVITGLVDSPNETMIVGGIRFSIPLPTDDNDGDGITNTDETLMGTNPDDPNSVLRLTQNAANPRQLDFPTVAGRFYRVYESSDASPATHLQSWTDAGLGTINGDGNPSGFVVTVSPGVSRRFYRLHVMQSDGNWPPAVP